MADDNGFKMTSTIPENERKCPNCGGTLTYNPNAEKLFCSFCGKYKEINRGTHDNVQVKGVAYSDILNSNFATPGDKCKLLSCGNCGAELIYDSTQISGSCPFCGSTNNIPVASPGSVMRPSGIIPFSIDENRARISFGEYLKSELLILNTNRYALENLVPVYLPYFSFDSDTVSDYLIDIGYRDSDGDIHYKTCKGSYKESFSDITVFASSKTQNDQIDKIREFQLSSVLPFNPDYMAGYYAERNSMTLKHAYEVVQYNITEVLNENIPEYALRKFKGDKYKDLRYKTKYSDTNYKYILAPFYLASLTHKGKKYDVAINGYNGDVACAKPSARKLLKKLLITLGIIAAGAFIGYLIYLFLNG